MTDSGQPSFTKFELFDSHPSVAVDEAEYRRLLGYPRAHVPGARAEELAAGARHWYAENGQPWVYMREVAMRVSEGALQLDGVEFDSSQLREHLRQAGAERALLLAVSAGSGCEEHARQLWAESKPDEYFFLEIFGSAVVEHLVATSSGRICELAERDDLLAVPHYSPGYTGWIVADQNKLFDLIARGLSKPFPGPLEVLTSGMLKPKKSLLAVIGLAPRAGRSAVSAQVPCTGCAFSPCGYRRAPYRHASLQGEVSVISGSGAAQKTTESPLAREGARYTVNLRALRKWADERVQLQALPDGSLVAKFRFDGTTCKNQGQPFAFDYTVTLSSAADGYAILNADCRPAPGDSRHTLMCAYVSDNKGLMQEIAEEKPLLGRPLNEVLGWKRCAAPSGCHCSTDTRTHKWGLALEAIHFALARTKT
jgi:hypothetical protein